MASRSAVIGTAPLTLNQRDVQALADRLHNTSVLASVSTQTTSDMRLASAVIRELWRRAFNSSDLLQIEGQ